MVEDLLLLSVESKSQIKVVYIRLLEVLDAIEGVRLEVIESGKWSVFANDTFFNRPFWMKSEKLTITW